MIELVRTNDLVAISLVESILGELGIAHAVLDQHMSVLEGSIGILPRRIVVREDQAEQARRILREAGLEAYLKSEEGTR